MTIHDDDTTKLPSAIPMATAVPIDAAPVVARRITTPVAKTPDDGAVNLTLPLHQDSGLMFDHDPPRITKALRPEYADYVGYYFSQLHLPQLEIVGLREAGILRQTLVRNQNVPRTLTLSATPPPNNTETLYIHTLEVNEELGVELSGFPPVIQSIASEAWASKVAIGQAVHAVAIPGQPLLTMQSGGFTAFRVQQALNEARHMVGRQLIVKDRREVLRTNDGRNDAMDLGGCCVVQ